MSRSRLLVALALLLAAGCGSGAAPDTAETCRCSSGSSHEPAVVSLACFCQAYACQRLDEHLTSAKSASCWRIAEYAGCDRTVIGTRSGEDPFSYQAYDVRTRALVGATATTDTGEICPFEPKRAASAVAAGTLTPEGCVMTACRWACQGEEETSCLQ
jgi:hypothetical protein